MLTNRTLQERYHLWPETRRRGRSSACKVPPPILAGMAPAPVIILLAAALVGAAQLLVQADQVVAALLGACTLLPALVVVRLRSASTRLAAVRLRASGRRGPLPIGTQRLPGGV